ncbi:MAG: DUF3291 domain-containing protein [Rhodospirillales bacterium]
MTSESPENLHLAEFNIAEAKYDLDDPRMADFVNNLDRINAMAERMPGFVWRLKDEPEGATAAAWDGNARLVDNLSVWETARQLETFVFKTAHRQIYARRHEWFPLMESHHFVMWWVEPGHRPSREEAQARLRLLDEQGPGPDAFGWDQLELADAVWREARCA